MRSKRLIAFLFLLTGVSASLRAGARQEDTTEITLPPGLQIDTVERLTRPFLVNDYSTIGFEAGLALNNLSFNPPKETTFVPNGPVLNLMFTHYSKLFGYMPYFGFQIGATYATGGFRFKTDKETKITPAQDGYTAARWKVAEVPFLMMFRVDAPHLRIMAKAGIYGGYRWGIHRTIHDNYKDVIVVISGYNPKDYVDAWRDIDRRWDYGLEGGLGFAAVFDPFEFHVNALLKYGWSSMYQPDYASQYYYRFAYPLDVFITAGIHFQLSRRTGKSKAQLRREAYDAVYNPNLSEIQSVQ